LNNRERAIIASIHMRASIKGLRGTSFAYVPAVITINVQCKSGEGKYNRGNSESYNRLLAIAGISGELYDRVYRCTMIATDTFLEVLYRSQEHEFRQYFKLKETPFVKLFRRFGEDDDREAHTFKAAEYIINSIDRAEGLYEWRKWIKNNQRNYDVCI